MACRTLELTLVSARDLRSPNLVSRMEVYAVVYLSGDPRTRHRVPTDRAGGRDPSWAGAAGATARLTVPASGAGSGAVRVLLRTERALGGDRDVGEVLIPLPDILAGAGDGPTAACFPVRRIGSSKTTQGVLNLSYKLGGVVQPPADLTARTAAGGPPLVQAGDDTSQMMAYLAAAAAAYSAARPTQRLQLPTPPVAPPLGAACTCMRSRR